MYNNFERGIGKLTDSKRLRELSLMESLPVSSRVEALKNPNFTDIDILMHIAKNDSDYKIKSAAASNHNLVNHQDFLMDIAKNDSNFHVRAGVCDSIHDDAFLECIVKNDADERVRDGAYKNISDKDILVDIAYATSDPSIQNNAISRINDPQCLLYLTQHSIFYKDEAFSRLVNDFPQLILMPSQVKDITDEDELLGIVENEWYYESRLQACSMIKNEDVLLDIIIDFSNKVRDSGYYSAKNRFYDEMMQTALKNINNEEILIEVAQMGIYPIYLDAIEKLKTINPNLSISYDIDGQNEETLSYIAKNAIHPRCRIFAVESIDDEDVLCSIVKTDQCTEVRKKCLEKITDEKTLVYVVNNDSDFSVRKKAMDGIKNEETFIDILLSCTDEDIIEMAIDGINDEDILFDFAKDNKNSDYTRIKAIESISNQEYLKEFAKNSTDSWLIQNALDNIHDVKFKFEIAKKDPSLQVRIYDFEEVDDEKDIESVIWNSSDWNYVLKALRYIKDESILENMVQNSPSETVRQLTIKSMRDADFNLSFIGNGEEHGKNDQLFLKIALNDSSYHVRKEAMDGIKDESILINLALNHPSYPIRQMATSRISDFSSLFEIYKNDSNDNVRYSAVKNGFFNNQEILIDIAKNDEYFPIVLIALEKIEDFDIVQEICRSSGDTLLCAFLEDIENKRFPSLGEIVLF